MRRCVLLVWLFVAACAAPGREDGSRADAEVGHASTKTPPAVARVSRSHVDSLLALGDSIFRRSPDSARVAWNGALEAARASSDSAGIARALTGLGQAARQLGDFGGSRRNGEQALALKQRLRLAPSELFRSYNALGLLAWNEERLAEASVLLDSAMQAARAANDSVAIAKALVNSGLIADDLGAFERARTSLERGRDMAAAVRDSVTLARALNNLARLDIQLGDPIAAVGTIATARTIARAVGDSTAEVNAIGQLATAYDDLGEPQRSFALVDSALAMATRGGRRAEQAEDLTLIANLFLDAGDYAHALDFYGRSFAITDSLGQPEERGNILRNEARAHAALGNLPLAEQRAIGARRIHQQGAFSYSELNDLIVLSTLAQQRGHAAEAQGFLRDARALAIRLDALIAAWRVAIAEAGIAAADRDWQRVLRALDRRRFDLQLAGSHAEAEALALEARAHEGLGHLGTALAVGRRAIAAVERVRGNYASGELRTMYASDRVGVYANQVLLLLRTGHVDEAFQVADGARGRALLEHLAAARADVRATGDPDAMLEREKLLRRIDALAGRLRQGESRPPRERSAASVALTRVLLDSLLAARGEYEALVARTGSKEVGAQPPGVTTVTRATTADVANSLAPGEVLLEYLVTKNRLVIFGVTEHGVVVRQVDEGEATLGSRVHLARELLQRRDGEAPARGVLSALYDILIQPLVESGMLQGARRLIVVPHGPLAYLPVAALLDRRTGRYVAERYAVLHLPTAAALPRLRSVVANQKEGRRVGADVFAPFPDSLAATRAEAEAIRRSLPEVRVHLGGSATKGSLRAALESGAIVHVATHARMNRRNPLFSAIDLAGESTTTRSTDARFEVHELLGLHVRSPLVFLSGCETALGGSWSTQFDTGEDYTTLSQTLLYSGAANVVATLWRIDDTGAANLVSQFYLALREGLVPEALARAQRAMLADSRYRSPYYWAAFEASGSGLPLARAKSLSLSDKR